MKLYQSPTSPYARKVRVMVQEAGMTGIEQILATGTPLDPGTIPVDSNPLGKIPALVLNDGMAIYDSRVICRFLDDHFGAGLYPKAPGLWPVLTLEATAEGILDAALLMVYEGRLRPQALHFAPWVEGQWAKIDRSLDAVESAWLPHLSGPLDMAQIALGCALGYLDFRHGARNWQATRPGLARWFAAFAARPAMRDTAPA